nr:hypothetical protein [Tanacetum cinerariifolium]
MIKMFKGKGVMKDKAYASSSHAHVGASDHMSPHLNLFISTKNLKTPIIVHLPDGSSKTVTIVGQVQLTPSLILTNVFYVPDFQLNLLFVVTIPYKDKFDKMGTKCVLLGYPLNQKGYTLYILETKETFHSKDVIFDESVFPFKDCNKHTPPMVTTNFPTFGDEECAENPTINIPSIPNIVILNTPNSPTPAVVDFVSTIPSSSTNEAPPEQDKISTKQTNKPVWLKDFVDPTANKSTPHYPLFVSIDFLGIPKPYITFLANELTKFLIAEGYQQSKHDYSFFVKTKDESFTAALVYVDDVLITGNSPSKIQHLRQALDTNFTIKYLGLAKYFLGIEICNTANGSHLNQRKYIMDLLIDVGLTAAKPNPSPLPTNLKLSLNKFVPLSDPAAYRGLDVYLQAAIHLLKYLKGSVSKGLFYPVQPRLKVTGFSNADWPSCLMTRKSLTSYCIFLGHSLVLLNTKKQATINRSSTKAKYRSMATTTCEILWVSFFLKDLRIPVKLPITLFCDKSAQQIAANPCSHDRTKHMAIDCHFTREKVQNDFLQTAFIPSHFKLADIMTKALNHVQHSFLADLLGVSTALTGWEDKKYNA